MRFAPIVVLAVGCGSSPKSSTTTIPEDPKVDAEREAREKREKEIEAMKPADPYELRDKQAFQTNERCGQGPYRFESDSLKARYGERIEVYACGKHAITGNYRMTTTHKHSSSSTYERAFGYGLDNKACKGTPIAHAATGAGGRGAAGGGAGKSGGGSTAAAPANIEPTKLTKTSNISTDCVRTFITSHGWSSHGDAIAFDGKLVIDLWSEEPNDLEGLTFILERHAVVAGMTLERWKAYRAVYNTWYETYRAYLDGEEVAGRVTTVDRTVKTPPPPAPRAETPPPKPSKNARWIPGYWLYDETTFHWISGLWDVPEEDVKHELTVQAPTPPPAVPARAEQPTEPAPTRTAVWTPGSWYWDGRAYVWIAGAWRIPPPPTPSGAQHTWQRPTWSVRTGRAIYVPGGWRIRIGR